MLLFSEMAVTATRTYNMQCEFKYERQSQSFTFLCTVYQHVHAIYLTQMFLSHFRAVDSTVELDA